MTLYQSVNEKNIIFSSVFSQRLICCGKKKQGDYLKHKKVKYINAWMKDFSSEIIY